VSEYVTCFTQLSRYAPNDVDTDEKKQECFPQWIGGWCLCFRSLRLREFSDHGRQVSCAQEQKRNTVKQAQAGASDPIEHQPQASRQCQFFAC
jgi:hypothetical protein